MSEQQKLWAVESVNGTVQAVHTRAHAEAMVEALTSMGIAVEAVEWPGDAAEHAACMAESAKWAEPVQ